MFKNIKKYWLVKNIIKILNLRYIITNLGEKYIRTNGIISNICYVLDCSNHDKNITNVIKTYNKNNDYDLNKLSNKLNYSLNKFSSTQNSYNNDIESKV